MYIPLPLGGLHGEPSPCLQQPQLVVSPWRRLSELASSWEAGFFPIHLFVCVSVCVSVCVCVRVRANVCVFVDSYVYRIIIYKKKKKKTTKNLTGLCRDPKIMQFLWLYC